jgi:phage terminase large subunit-like protein
MKKKVDNVARNTKAWTRNVADERAVARGCYFDLAAAERVRTFFSTFLRHGKGRWAGEPFELLDWQWERLIAPLFGWKREDGTRRFRKAYVELPKKNGKSTLCSGLATYMLVADGEDGAEVYCAAADKAQAGIVFNEAANMVEKSPKLAARLQVIRSTKRMTFLAKQSILQALSADVKTKEGLNAHAVIFDELHAQPNRRMFDTLVYAGASRAQPLHIYITTAGHDTESICYEQHEYALAILSGEKEDDEFFAFVAAADPGDDWEDEKTWKKANPSYGITIKPEDFRAAYIEAKNKPAARNSFKRYRLNIWTEQETLWIAPEQWAACAGAVDREELAGRACHAGLDLAKTGDLTALVLIFPAEDDFIDVLPFFWIPEDKAKEKEETDKVPYRQWAEEGLITLTPGATTDYRAVRQTINELKEEFELIDAAYDDWNAQHLVTEMRDEDGMEDMWFAFFQNIKNFNEPSKEFEELVTKKKIRHGGHKVLAWNAKNCTVITDRSGNIRPVKPKHTSSKRVDGIVALIMALGRSIVNPSGAGTNYGEGHELLVL